MQFDMTNSLSGMLQKHFNHDNIINETFYVCMYRWTKRPTHALTTSVITGLRGKGVIEGWDDHSQSQTFQCSLGCSLWCSLCTYNQTLALYFPDLSNSHFPMNNLYQTMTWVYKMVDVDGRTWQRSALFVVATMTTVSLICCGNHDNSQPFLLWQPWQQLALFVVATMTTVSLICCGNHDNSQPYVLWQGFSH